MEGGNKKGGSVGSSFTTDLFGSKESLPSSSTGVFASMFAPPSTVLGRKSSSTYETATWQKNSSGNQFWNTKQGTVANGEPTTYNMLNKERNSIFQDERAEPCHLSSSLYYGGQDNYSQPHSSQTVGSYPIFKKDGGDDDSNGNNSNSASRGNWWQGSLYY